MAGASFSLINIVKGGVAYVKNHGRLFFILASATRNVYFLKQISGDAYEMARKFEDLCGSLDCN